MVHIYNGILFSQKRNAFESVLMRWMNLEPILQSEVSQKEKNKKNKLVLSRFSYEPICRAAVETQALRTDSRTQLGREER